MSNGERVELFKSINDNLWYFRRVAANNEIVSESEGYQNRADAVHTATKIFSDVPIVQIMLNEDIVSKNDEESDGSVVEDTEPTV